MGEVGGDRETDNTAKTTLKGCGMERTIPAYKLVVALVSDLAEVKGAHARLVDISAQSEADVIKAQADLESCNVRFTEVEQA